ncbi:YdeI/OmpD-associated family protein [Frateuria defendens]|uniref:YdeI/OmpD-associated family protein n=1 Tax=Frateuria defendens TaxID=2219559 RepID=UPI00066FD4A1|nr:YdeI/OmpD-associated family protein [Frateuria defendens]
MPSRDPRIDAYIAKAAPFAQPILEHVRARVHAACPEVEESTKWGFPHFGYRGAMMCSIAAFKRHCALGFWLHEQVVGEGVDGAMGQFGRLTALADLPSDKQFEAYIRKAMALNEAGVKRSRPEAAPRPPPELPADLATALAKQAHAVARRTWTGFSASAQREYAGWLDEAKTEATRHKRLATTLEWLAEGKQRNWKYQR